MEKVVWVLLSFVVLALLFSSLATAAIGEDVESGLGDLQKSKESVEALTEETRWESLGEQWKELLLRNKLIFSINGFFEKTSPALFVALGENYELSFTFFVVLALWIYFLFAFSEILMLYSLFTKWIALAIAAGINIIASHLGLYHSLSEIIFRVIFYKEGVWSWVLSILIIGVAIFIFFVARMVHQEAEKGSKISAEKKQEADQKYLSTFVDTLKKGINRK